MTRLSVNVNKIATIRNSRGGNLPNLLTVACDCEKFGADGITVHPRPDERHIRYTDVHALKPLLKTEFNVEGYPSHKFLELVLRVKPNLVTLVPDPPHVLTSNQGWDTVNNAEFLKDIISKLKDNGIKTSIFMETNIKAIEKAVKTKADCIELYTEDYVKMYHKDKETAVEPYIKAANCAHELGFEVHAGHDLNLDNLEYLHKCIPSLEEVSIGHALISDALYFGLEKTIHMYKERLNHRKKKSAK